jgi:hypothetical protein
LSENEKHRMIVEIWTTIKTKIESKLKDIVGSGNDLFSMIDAGAR